MRDAIDDHIAFFNSKYGTPITLTDPVGSQLSDQPSNAKMQRVRRRGYPFQTLQQPPCIGLWQCSKLFENLRWYDKPHTLTCSLTANNTRKII